MTARPEKAMNHLKQAIQKREDTRLQAREAPEFLFLREDPQFRTLVHDS